MRYLDPVIGALTGIVGYFVAAREVREHHGPRSVVAPRKKSLGRSVPLREKQSMRDEDSVVINRPIEDVWAFVTDVFNAPRVWGNGWVALRQTSPGSLGVGSTLQGRMVILGFETKLNFVITEWDPPHALGLSMAFRPIRSYDARITLETIGDGTKMVRSVEFEPRGPLSFVWPFIGPYLIRQRHAMTRNLKRFIEAKPR